MHVSIRRLLLVLFAVCGVVGLVATGCGGDDDADPSDDAPQNTVADGDSGASSDSGDSSADDAADDPENPVLLGLQVSGPEGASLEIEAIAYADGQAQQPMDLVANVRDEPWYFLFSTFIDSAELTLGPGTGGTVTVEAVRGQATDPEDPTAGITIREVLETIELDDGETATIQLP